MRERVQSHRPLCGVGAASFPARSGRRSPSPVGQSAERCSPWFGCRGFHPTRREGVGCKRLHLTRDAASTSVSRHYSLYAAAIGTGMRQGELLGLNWADIDFEGGTVDVRRSLSQVGQEFILKGTQKSKLPAIYCSSTVRPDCLPRPSHRGTEGGVDHRSGVLHEDRQLPSAIKRPEGVSDARQANERRRRAQLAAETKRQPESSPRSGSVPRPSPHSRLGLIASGHSIKAVSRRLGHADVSMTLKVYAHLLPDDDVKLASGAGILFG